MRFKKITLILLIIFVIGFIEYGVSEQKITPSFREKEITDSILDIPNNILKQERSGIIDIWGVPVNEDYNIGTAEEVLTYYTPEFKLIIKFFVDTPIEINAVPLKEYKISGDIMKLLADLGFDEDLERATCPGQTLFLYKTTSKDRTREYEIHFKCIDSTIVSRVYIKLVSC